MNDLEREIRDTLLRHQTDAPPFDSSDARRAVGRAHRRQARNVAVGIVGAVAVIVALAGPGGVVRADRSDTVIAPPPLPTCESSPGPDDAEVRGWPTTVRNRAGVYSWDATWDTPGPASSNEGFMHNGYEPGSSDVNIIFEGVPGRLIPHRGMTTVAVAGCEGTYRRFLGSGPSTIIPGPTEEWMVDVQGTTVTISLVAEPKATEAEMAEAHEIIESIRIESQDNDFGFRLVFTLKTDTWDSG